MSIWKDSGLIRTYRCLSILPASLYFLSNRLRTLCLRIQSTFDGILASLVPFLLPGPVCLPFRFAANRAFVRARECTVVGLMITRPSLMSFLTCVRELAFPISACSAGSSQIFLFPTPATLAARRFCDRRLTKSCQKTIRQILSTPELQQNAPIVGVGSRKVILVFEKSKIQHAGRTLVLRITAMELAGEFDAAGGRMLRKSATETL